VCRLFVFCELQRIPITGSDDENKALRSRLWVLLEVRSVCGSHRQWSVGLAAVSALWRASSWRCLGVSVGPFFLIGRLGRPWKKRVLRSGRVGHAEYLRDFTTLAMRRSAGVSPFRHVGDDDFFSCNRLSGEASDTVSALLLLTRIVAEHQSEFRPSHLTPMPPEVILGQS
jgi:hypothetical protein